MKIFVPSALFIISIILSFPVFPNTISFQGDMAVSQWNIETTIGDGSVDTANAPDFITLNGADNGVGLNVYTSFTTTTQQDQTIGFDWIYTSYDVDGSTYDPFGYLLNGNFAQLTVNDRYGTQIGYTEVDVLSGDTFGFAIVSLDNVWGPAVVTVGDLNNATANVSEPANIALIGIGFIGLLASQRKKFAS